MEKELRVVALNTGPYNVAARGQDKRSESYVADEDMYIAALEHFIGISSGGFPSDNGHILSKSPDNPWAKWTAPLSMEPTGTKGYFGYCGRDYYSQVSGIQDILAYEAFPPGCHFFVKKGERLYMHCYAGNFTDAPAGFHHAVRVIYFTAP